MTDDDALVPGHCERHGAFTTPPWQVAHTGVVCPTCSAEQSRRRDLLAASNLRGRFLNTTFSTFKGRTPAQRGVAAACHAFIDDLVPWHGGSLWLLGRVGTGKSHLLAAMAHASIARDIGVLVASPRGIVRALRDTWQRNAPETEGQLITRLAAVPVLLLDEVGVGLGTEAEQVQLLDVIDRRYQLQGATAIASNLNEKMLRDALGDRIFDRLHEGSQKLGLDWPSHRAEA